MFKNGHKFVPYTNPEIAPSCTCVTRIECSLDAVKAITQRMYCKYRVRSESNDNRCCRNGNCQINNCAGTNRLDLHIIGACAVWRHNAIDKR